MDPTVSIILALVVGVALGALIGWLYASRASAADAERAARAAELQKLLDAVTAERDEALQAKAALAGRRPQFRRPHGRPAEIARGAGQPVPRDRRQAAGEGPQGFPRQGRRALHRGRQGDRDQAARSCSQPVEATLKRYEEGLQRVEKERVDHYAGLREAVELVRAGQGQVRDETRNLVNALRSSPKARGRWGEQSLRNVLEQAGLSPYADFRSEVSVDGEDGKLRPDVVVRLPGGRQLIIDAKCSLNAYLDACDEVDDDKREACFRAHLASIRNHAQQLGSKAYWAQFGDTAEYVVMYIPGEHFLTAALERDDGLWDWAFERRVLLATPTNLVAIARTVAAVWQQEKLAEAAGEIAALGKELHSRLATMAQHMERVGKNLSTANAAYNQMVGSFESQVLTQARRFETLGAGSAKDMPMPPMVEASPRPLTKIAAAPAQPTRTTPRLIRLEM